MSHDGARLEPLIRMLWGAEDEARLLPARSAIPDGHVVVDSFMVLPSLQRPRLLLPTAAPPGAQALLLRAHNEPPYVGPRSMLPGLRKGLQLEPLNTMVGTPVRVVLPEHRTGSTLRHLVGRQLRTTPTDLVLSLSLRSDNVRPLVRVAGLDGSPLVFLKVGTTPLHIQRLGREQATLRELQLNPSPGIRTAVPLMDADVHGRRVIGSAALAIDTRRVRSVTPDSVANALSELQASQPMGFERLSNSRWMQELRARVDEAPKPLQEPLHSHLDRINKHYGSTFYAMGRTHGDWVPWNMAWTSEGDLGVWDWEHSHPHAPLLLDSMHWHYGIATVLRNGSVASGVSSVREHVRTMSSAPPGLAAVFFAEHAVRRAEEVRSDDLTSRERALRALRALALAY